MKRFEWKFLDGPGAGRSVFSDHAPATLWLCGRLGKRWWTFKEPEKMFVEATYELRGHAPRLEGPTLLTYGQVE